MRKRIAFIIFLGLLIYLAYYLYERYENNKRTEYKDEQINISEDASKDTSINSIDGTLSLNNILSKPNNVILTGLPAHRLVTIYRKDHFNSSDDVTNSSSRYYTEYDENGNETEIAEYYVPGIQILYGYNLLNIAHYDISTRKLSYFFSKPALVKTVYYPSFTQDSINKIPVIRNYYLVSVYDEDTNKDKLINRRDLRNFYYYDLDCSKKIRLLPPHYSALRSQYDSQNDILYLFAKNDSNHNGSIEKDEPLKIFWLDLKSPLQAFPLY